MGRSPLAKFNRRQDKKKKENWASLGQFLFGRPWRARVYPDETYGAYCSSTLFISRALDRALISAYRQSPICQGHRQIADLGILKSSKTMGFSLQSSLFLITAT